MIELHHVIGDKGVQDVLETELDALYHADQPLADLPTKYRNYVATVFGGSGPVNKSYWTEYLKDAPQSLILTSSPMTDLGDCRQVDVPLLPLETIKQFSRSQECTQSSLFKALWAVVLQILIGSQDVAFFYLVSTRYAPGVQAEGAIGYYLELLLAWVRAAETTSFKETLRAVQGDYSQALTHQFAAIDTVQELGLGKRMFNTYVNHRRHHRAESEEEDSTSCQESFGWIYHDRISNLPFDIKLCIDEFHDAISAYFVYWDQKILPETTEICNVFTNCLSLVLANPDITLSQICADVRVGRANGSI